MFSEPRSDDARAVLAAPPEDKYALLEFALDWPGMHGVGAQLAAALRLFVITRDPLDWLADRGRAWATANANGDTLELPVYITRDEVQRQMQAGGGGLATTLGTIGESVLVAATHCQGCIFAGAFPTLRFKGKFLVHSARPRPQPAAADARSPCSDGELSAGALTDTFERQSNDNRVLTCGHAFAHKFGR